MGEATAYALRWGTGDATGQAPRLVEPPGWALHLSGAAAWTPLSCGTAGCTLLQTEAAN